MKVVNNLRCVKEQASVTANESIQTIDIAACESHRQSHKKETKKEYTRKTVTKDNQKVFVKKCPARDLKILLEPKKRRITFFGLRKTNKVIEQSRNKSLQKFVLCTE